MSLDRLAERIRRPRPAHVDRQTLLLEFILYLVSFGLEFALLGAVYEIGPVQYDLLVVRFEQRALDGGSAELAVDGPAHVADALGGLAPERLVHLYLEQI